MDFVAFKVQVAMQDWAVGGTHKLAIRYQKSGIARDVVICAQQDYPFRISETFQDTGLCQSCQARAEHICVGAYPVGRAVPSSQAWLQRIIPHCNQIRSLRRQYLHAFFDCKNHDISPPPVTNSVYPTTFTQYSSPKSGCPEL